MEVGIAFFLAVLRLFPVFFDLLLLLMTTEVLGYASLTCFPTQVVFPSNTLTCFQLLSHSYKTSKKI